MSDLPTFQPGDGAEDQNGAINFKPKPYQENVFHELAKDPSRLNMLRPRRFYYGVDVGQPGGDKTVLTRAKINGRGQITQIVFDEFAEYPDWKWYRNPIKWYKWRRLWKIVEKNYGRIK